MENPIIDNRIVYDKRFAYRLKQFVSDVGHRYGGFDYDISREWGYLDHIAELLLKYQVETVDLNNKEEVDYLKRCANQTLKTNK